MVRDSVCTMANVQGPYAQTASTAGCGRCLEDFTSADFDCLCALIMRLRQHIEAACTPAADHYADDASESPNVPLISLGPSGLGGPYQTEI